jgi:hypothetical protein
MTKEEFKEIKEAYLYDMKSMLFDNGDLPATITIIGSQIEDNKTSVVHIPLPEEIINSDEGKQLFVDKMIPQLSKKIKEKFNVHAVAWASEAWMRETNKNSFNVDKDDYKELPIKKEILIFTIDTNTDTETYVYEIVRMSIAPNGDLVEKIDLLELPEMGNSINKSKGRFSDLYKKFTD